MYIHRIGGDVHLKLTAGLCYTRTCFYCKQLARALPLSTRVPAYTLICPSAFIPRDIK